MTDKEPTTEPVPAAKQGSLRASLKAVIYSRLIIFICGIYALLSFQPNRATDTLKYDRLSLTRPFDGFWDIVLSPWARWDSIWYLGIANDGYQANSQEPAFFPLYPLLTRIFGGVISFSTNPNEQAIYLGGLAVSLLSLTAAGYLLHRLVSLEIGSRYAQPTLLFLMFFPMAIFFSAIYSESLFLALSIGCFYAARRDRWWIAGLLGACAAATRNSGLLLILPLLILYLWGPRREPPTLELDSSTLLKRLKPRYRIKLDSLALLVPALGTASYVLYLQLKLGDWRSFIDAQEFWQRDFKPLGGITDGAKAAWEALSALVGDQLHPTNALLNPNGGTDPLINHSINLMLFIFLILAVVAVIGIFRRLPLAYGAYTLAALLLPLSSPSSNWPLWSLPRFIGVLFPIFIWLAYTAEQRQATARWIGVSAVALGLFTAQWVNWQLVT